MRHSRVLRVFVLVAVGFFLAASRGDAQDRLIVAYSTNSEAQVPLWVSKESGAFARNGLDVELVFIEGGSRTIQAMLGGDVSLALTGGPEIVQAVVKGASIVAVGATLHTYPYVIVGLPGITRPDQLKGKKIAVSRFGSSSHFATLQALERWGLLSGKDVTILQIGNTPARFGALTAGTVDAAIMSVGGQTLKARKSGFTLLGDLNSLGVEYLGNAIVVNRQFLTARRDVVRRFMKGFVEGIHFLKTRKDESKAIIGKYLRTSDPEVLEEGYEQYAVKLVPKKPYPNPKGVAMILREIAESEPSAREARPEQFVDPSIVKELDESGYIDSLYK